MKADVQYNDFKGTAAADISDHTSLEDFLNDRGIDVVRFTAIGAEFYSGYSDFFSASILCVDNEKSVEQKKHIVSMEFEITKDDFFELFKRFNVVITDPFGGYDELEIDELITFNEDNLGLL